jgi:hypothetical protein
MQTCLLCNSAVSVEAHYIDWTPTNTARRNRVLLCKQCRSAVRKLGYLTRRDLIAIRRRIMRRDPGRFESPATGGLSDLQLLGLD